MKKLGIISFFLLITALNIFALGNNEARGDRPKGPDYDKIATTLNVDLDDVKNAFEESDLGNFSDLKKVASILNVTEKELQDAMGPPPQRGNEPELQAQPNGPEKGPEKGSEKSNGKIYSSLTADYGSEDFEINSVAIENGTLLETFKCEEKIDGKQNSIPLSWNNIPEETKSLAVVMYHYPDPNDKTNRNSYLLLWGIDPTVSDISYGEADDGEWYMGPNKDGNTISYTSPCSKGPGTHEYLISIFALSEYPELLPQESSVDVTFDLFMTAIEDVKILGRADIVFKDITK